MTIKEMKKLADALRAEADRLESNAGRNFMGWQAVQTSLREIANSIDPPHEEE